MTRDTPLPPSPTPIRQPRRHAAQPPPLPRQRRFAIAPMPSPRAPRDGWAVGMAVKRDATELAQALARAVNELATSGRLRQMFERGHVAWQSA